MMEAWYESSPFTAVPLIAELDLGAEKNLDHPVARRLCVDCRHCKPKHSVKPAENATEAQAPAPPRENKR
jgi:hypothetical protein